MQTDCRPQKRGRGLVGPCSDPLVGPRDPACRDALGAAPHSSCSCDRLVGLATSSSGRRTRSPHQKQTATVMLELFPLGWNQLSTVLCRILLWRTGSTSPQNALGSGQLAPGAVCDFTKPRLVSYVQRFRSTGPDSPCEEYL